jgi:hypothetical protein
VSYVNNYEEQYYPVHPSQLAWGMSTLAQQPGRRVMGYAPDPANAGMYIIVVQVPVGAPQADWRSAPARRRQSWRIDGRQVLSWLCVLVIVGGLGYLGYTMYSGGTLPTWGEIADNLPQLPERMPWESQPQGEPVVESTGWHWPWESSVISKPKQQAAPFRWPWEDAAKAAADTVDMVKNVTLAVVAMFVVGLVLWFVGKVKGVMR